MLRHGLLLRSRRALLGFVWWLTPTAVSTVSACLDATRLAGGFLPGAEWACLAIRR